MLRALALMLTCAYTSLAQGSVPTEFLYHRVWAVVPLIGKGTKDDPMRPMFVPSPAEDKARAEKAKGKAHGRLDDSDIPTFLSYTMLLSDDKKSALVEFVGLNPQTMAPITQSKAQGVKVFERGKTTKEEVEAEFKKVKKDFTLDKLHGNSGNGNGGQK